MFRKAVSTVEGWVKRAVGGYSLTFRYPQRQSGFFVLLPTTHQYVGAMHYAPSKSYPDPPLVPQGLFSAPVVRDGQQLIPHALGQCFHDQVCGDPVFRSVFY